MNIIPFHQLQSGMMVAMLIYSNIVPNVCCRVASIQFQFNMIFNSLEESFRLNLRPNKNSNISWTLFDFSAQWNEYRLLVIKQKSKFVLWWTSTVIIAKWFIFGRRRQECWKTNHSTAGGRCGFLLPCHREVQVFVQHRLSGCRSARPAGSVSSGSSVLSPAVEHPGSEIIVRVPFCWTRGAFADFHRSRAVRRATSMKLILLWLKLIQCNSI